MTVRLATPVEMRESLEMARTMGKYGVRFVCVPVMNEDDYDQMLSLSMSRLDALIERADAEEVAQ
jgi:hypothetical protein